MPPEWEKMRVNFQPSLTSVRYVQARPIVYQGMLLSAILSALKQQHNCHMHRYWRKARGIIVFFFLWKILNSITISLIKSLTAMKSVHAFNVALCCRHWVAMVTSALPFLARALSNTLVVMVTQLCRNLELLAQQYELADMYRRWLRLMYETLVKHPKSNDKSLRSGFGNAAFFVICYNLCLKVVISYKISPIKRFLLVKKCLVHKLLGSH